VVLVIGLLIGGFGAFLIFMGLCGEAEARDRLGQSRLSIEGFLAVSHAARRMRNTGYFLVTVGSVVVIWRLRK
jgi:hypothetical protein